MDRNQIIGFSLLLVLLAVYVGYNSKAQKEFQEQKRKQATADSIARAKMQPSVAAASDTLFADSLRRAQQAVVDTNLPPALQGGTAQEIVLENNDLALTFSTKGARPVRARLKNFKTFSGQSLDLFAGNANGLSFTLPTDNGRSTGELMFTASPVTEVQGSKALSFTADMGSGKRVDLIYSLPAERGMMQVTVRTAGMNATSLPFTWNIQGLHSERDIMVERQNAQVYHQYKGGDNDYFTITENREETYKENLQWLGFRKHYFTSAIISEDGFSHAALKATVDPADTNVVATVNGKMELPLRNGEGRMQWYIGPNQYKVLKSYGVGLDEMVPLGSGITFFTKYINKWIIIPVFNFLHDGMGIVNMGVIIMILTLFIRLLLSFFTYKSYLSSAKMRVLKPELDELREKYKDDQQAMGMEQMKMYRTAGVNPLGGCIPMLLQIPILFAMYHFFPSAIELRQKSFLWANDLSTYDSVLNLPFNIPFYGDHVSLFTLLMTVSSLALALYNKNMTPQDPNNPMLKWMPFIFPILLLGVFNKMAAALTFYYFCSNVVALIQQYVIQKAFINEEKIHAQIRENRNKPAQPSKWAQRMEEMQKAQMERMKQPPRRGN